MGFDESTLQPTYELRVGLPGKSAGLDIATRLELPRDVIAHARSVMPRLEADFQSLLAKLHTQIEENTRRQAALDQQTIDLAAQQLLLRSEMDQKEEKRRREWERKTEELIRSFEKQATDAMDRVLQASDQRKAAEQAQRLISKTKREIREGAADAFVPAEGAKALPPRPKVEEGVRVRLKDFRDPATVKRLLKNDILEVEAGFLKLQVSLDDVVEVLGAGQGLPLPKNVNVQLGPRFETSFREINVVGQRADEAIDQVDKFLDSAALASVNRVRIVHGHGMGVLKKAVSDLLQKNPHVGRYYPATPSEGGAGATIVELRE